MADSIAAYNYPGPTRPGRLASLRYRFYAHHFMRAAFCPAPRAIELREMPDPVSAGETVVVRVHACGICGSDLHYYCGAAPPPRVPLGHEISGRVADPGSSGFAVGEPVVVEPLISCGHCDRC